ncbi:hypothetical protein [Streptomyces luteogriseus]|uniref:hypothetical protein n=1 Tax=Streptomyces luteogriseus TaxID=68233 RepID=UPI00379CDC7F
MSKPFEYADGVTGREPQGAPNVYLPQAAAPPVYDAYADPAAAHGWQDVYDPTDYETTAYGTTDGGGAGHPAGADGTGGSRPGAHPVDGAYPVDGGHPVDGAYPVDGGHPVDGAYPVDGGHPVDGADATRAYPGGPYPDGMGGAEGAGDTRELPAVPRRGRAAGGGHRARRKPAPRPARRLAVAAGAVGAASAVALIAGFALSGSPSGGTRDGEGGRTGPTAGESPTAESGASSPAKGSDAPLVAGPGGSDGPSGTASVSPSSEAGRTPSASGTDGAPPPAAGSTSGASTDPAPTDTALAPGRSGEKPGRGPGGTKGPK